MSTGREVELPTLNISARVFLNYASEDRELAVWLQARLLEAGVADVWLDRKEIEGGERWKREIDVGLCRATVLLALLTKSSVDPSREWIEYERREAKRLFKPIIPLRFDVEAELPKALEHLHYIDFAGDRDAALPALRSAIARHTLRCTSLTPLTAEPPPLRDGFVGRENELQALFELIDDPTAYVETARPAVAIQGMGGQGKTMLAEELTRRIAARYPGGLIIERRGQTQEPVNSVLERWAKLVLGEPLPRSEYHPADVRSLLGRYGELLVLMDDVSESDFEATGKLLDALPPDATRLVTTRSLNVGSELGCVVFELGRLSDDDARELVRQRLRSKNAARRAREISPAQDEMIRRLVELVQGHALALELAAGRCNFPKDLPKVLKRLTDSLARGLDDMAVKVAGAPTKNNSVAVSLNISLEHLWEYDREEGTNWAERFAALGVFPDSGRMNKELIAAVWGDAGDDEGVTEDALDGLYHRAMIGQESDVDLYFLHPLLRALARGLLGKEPERLAAAQLRYRDFLTRAAERGFREPEEQWSRMQLYVPHLLHTAAELWDEWTLRLGDLDALAQPEAPAADVTLADPAARDHALRAVSFTQAVIPYVLRRPAFGEAGGRLLKLGLACARAAGARELLDTFVRSIGAWCARKNPPAAERYFAQALRWAEQTGDPAEQGKVLSDYGELQRNRSRLDHAVELLGRALAIHEGLGDAPMQASTHKSLGEALCRQCDFDTAMEHYRRAMDIYRELKDRSGEADLLNKVGSLKFNRGDYREAISDFLEALPIHQEVGNRSMEGEDRNDMGIAYNYLGQHEEALRHLKEAVEIHGQLGNRRLEAVAMSNRAAAFYALGRRGDPGAYESALQEARTAGAVAREVECKFTQVWALNWEALAEQGLGRFKLAQSLLEKADGLLKETEGPRERVATWGTLGYLLGKHLGERKRGAALLRQAIELMSVNRFERAFGGLTKTDLEAQLEEVCR